MALLKVSSCCMFGGQALGFLKEPSDYLYPSRCYINTFELNYEHYPDFTNAFDKSDNIYI